MHVNICPDLPPLLQQQAAASFFGGGAATRFDAQRDCRLHHSVDGAFAIAVDCRRASQLFDEFSFSAHTHLILLFLRCRKL
jgi:hypothetical protein